MSYKVFGLGNPLLDLQTKDASLLQKYNLKANDAILAEPQHEPIYDEILAKNDVEYTGMPAWLRRRLVCRVADRDGQLVVLLRTP